MKQEKELLDEIALLTELRVCQRELGDLISNSDRYRYAIDDKRLRLKAVNKRYPDGSFYSSAKDDSLIDDIIDKRVMPGSWKLRDYARAVMELADAVKAKEEADKNENELKTRIKEIKKKLGIE